MRTKHRLTGPCWCATVMIAPGGNVNEHSALLLAEDDDGTLGMQLAYDGSANKFHVFGKASGTLHGPHLTIERGSATTTRIGIRNDSPDSELDIDGQIKIRGGSPGDGKVLMSDADGLA